MSLSNTNYFKQARLGNLQENWLFQLYYDSGFTGVAMQDTTVDSVYYRGVVLGSPTIRSKMDLATSKASVDNLTIKIADSHLGSNFIDGFSRTLLYGSNNYINREVKVYSQLGGNQTLADCLQIGLFRLTNISYNSSEITLQLASYRPWDFISIPNTKVDRRNMYIPVSYGNFTGNTSTDADPTFCANYSLRPCPLIEYTNQKFIFANGDQTSAVTVHYYDKNIDRLVPVQSSDTTINSGYGTNWVSHPEEVRYAVQWKPNDYDHDTVDASWASPEAAYDDYLAVDTSTAATCTKASSSLIDGENDFDVDYKVPDLDMELDSTGTYTPVFSVKYSITVTALAGSNSQIALQYWNGSAYAAIDTQNSVGTTSGTHSYALDIDTGVKLRAMFFRQSGGTCTGNVKIIDIVCQGSADVDWTDRVKGKNATNSIKECYNGGDGLTDSWASGAITEIHEAHRDLMIRYAGYTTTTPYNWSSNLNIDSIKDWGIRWWTLKPESLKKILEKLQYEGGFIFKWRADGTGSYWCVKDSYSSSDVAATLTRDDVSGLAIGHTPFEQLLTKMDINYERHPAKNSYLTTTTSSNATSRTKWNIQTKENIKEVKLDAYVSPTIPTTPGTNPNDDFYSYYDNIFGDIKIIVKTTVVNPAYYNLETGDIVQFSNVDPEKVFASAWSGKYFMLTMVNRSPGKLGIEAREVS